MRRPRSRECRGSGRTAPRWARSVVHEAAPPKPCSDDRAAERRPRARARAREELRLGDLAALELEQRVHAVVRDAVRDRLAERLGRDADALLQAREGVDQRRGEHAAEVGDDRLGSCAPQHVVAPDCPRGRPCASGRTRSRAAAARGRASSRRPPRRRRAAGSRRPRRPTARGRRGAGGRPRRRSSRAAARRRAGCRRRRAAAPRSPPARGRRRRPGGRLSTTPLPSSSQAPTVRVELDPLPVGLAPRCGRAGRGSALLVARGRVPCTRQSCS